jgi:hypothetical protein
LAKDFPVIEMGMQKGITYIAKKVDLKIKIIDFQKGGKIETLYTRNGYSQTVHYDPDKLIPYITDETLYTTDQLNLF